MNLKSLIASLVLANYLFLAGIGCISRPEQDPFLLLIQTKADASHHYESSRYLRTSALEAFMAESLATNYEKASDGPSPHVISVIIGVDTHYLPDSADPAFTGSFLEKPSSFSSHEAGRIRMVVFAIDAPPKFV